MSQYIIRNVSDFLKNAALKQKDKVALADANRKVTFEQLNKTAYQIADALIQKGIRRRPVAVLIDRDVTSVEAFWGIIYSGNFYVPIDKKMPSNRTKSMLEKIEPAMILGKEADRQFLSEVYDKCSYMAVEEQKTRNFETARVDKVQSRMLDTDSLYAIFTSGSTGMPKGVLISHRSVIDLTEQFLKIFPFTEQDVFANQAPFDFDVSVKDLFISMRLGATLHIVPQTYFAQPKKLLEFLVEQKITTLIWAASAVSLVQTYRLFEKEVPISLNKIMFSGEVLPMKALHYWQKYLPDAMYVNLYGPTEITCNCTYYIVDEEFREEEVLPIGMPFPNTEILLLDKENRLVCSEQPGVLGEICVRGTSLALGYYKEPEKTKAVFCQNPMHDEYEELIYRTGDLGKYNDKGQLVFASRADSQIKHMGHRIELGEIENAMNALSYIEKSCCLYDKEQKKNCAYLSGKG